MSQITNNGVVFQIADEIQAEYPELIKLVLNTKSMDDQERQYWFDILPSMSNEQIDRLYDILDTEKKKLEQLEASYQKEIKSLNEKHLVEWQAFQMKDNKQKIAKAQEEDAKSEQNPDDILNMLNNL
ncbi:hypothetical protein EOM39_02850 [Candidatus Gracilibacteria bacterium]|nr:hypothetical protein [Candidatus Gracilibacteria bacterium]